MVTKQPEQRPAPHLAVDDERCVGSGQCVMVAPNVFDQRDDDGIVVLLQSAPDRSEINAVSQAILQCPASAIHMVDPIDDLRRP